MALAKKLFRFSKTTLNRVVGTKELFSIGYGDVGSSIYYSLGVVAFYALGATPLALLLAGCVFICTALTYAELSSTFPEVGGAATFTRYAFNDLISFIAGWGLLLDYLLTLATSAFTVTPYLHPILKGWGIPFLETPLFQTVSTLGIIFILFLVNLIGLRSSGLMSFIMALFTLVSQAAIVILGVLFVLNVPFVLEQIRIGIPNVANVPSWGDFWKGTAMAMVAYVGIEAVTQMAGEAKNPQKAVPRAIKWVILVVLVLYLGLSFIGLSVVSPHELGTVYVNNPIGGIVEQFPVGGKILAPVVSIMAAVILVICANAGLIGCSRLMFAMGSHYQVPSYLFKLHSRFATPHIALAAFSIFAGIVIIASRNQLMFLADLYNFGAQVAFFSAHISLLVLRYKRKDLDRPFRAPLNIPLGKGRSVPLTAVIGALACFGAWLLVVITKPDGRIAGLCWMALGLFMYAYYRKKKKLPVAAKTEIVEVAPVQYKPFIVKNILAIVYVSKQLEDIQIACQLALRHKAHLKVVYLVEMPDSLPIDFEGKPQREKEQMILKEMEATTHEYEIVADISLIHTRSVQKTLLDLTKGQVYDLVVIGSGREDLTTAVHSTAPLIQFMKEASCRVIFCAS